MDIRPNSAASPSAVIKGSLPVPCERSRLLLLIRGICSSFEPNLDVDHLLGQHVGSEVELLEQLWHMHVMGRHRAASPDLAESPASDVVQLHLPVMHTETPGMFVPLTPETISGGAVQTLLPRGPQAPFHHSVQTFQLTPEALCSDVEQAHDPAHTVQSFQLTPDAPSGDAEQSTTTCASDAPSSLTAQTFQLTPDMPLTELEQALPHSVPDLLWDSSPHLDEHLHDYMWWVSSKPTRAPPGCEAIYNEDGKVGGGIPRADGDVPAAVDAETKAFLSLLQGCEPGGFSMEHEVIGALDPDSVKKTLEAVDLHILTCLEAQLSCSSSHVNDNLTDFYALASDVVAAVSAATALQDGAPAAGAEISRSASSTVPAGPLWWARPGEVREEAAAAHEDSQVEAMLAMMQGFEPRGVHWEDEVAGLDPHTLEAVLDAVREHARSNQFAEVATGYPSGPLATNSLDEIVLDVASEVCHASKTPMLSSSAGMPAFLPYVARSSLGLEALSASWMLERQGADSIKRDLNAWRVLTSSNS